MFILFRHIFKSWYIYWNVILYYFIGYFLCSLKFKETDIYEPEFDSFFELEKGIFLSPNKIAFYEVLCLQKINYNIFCYSAYDWIVQFTSNGVVFNSEMDDTNSIIIIKGHRHSLINSINKYTIKLLLSLTYNDIFFKYAPMYLALSLIQISREKFIKENLIKPNLFHQLIELYGIDYNDYKKCYEEIYIELIEEIKHNDKENEITLKSNKEKKGLINLKKFSVDKIKKTFKNKIINLQNLPIKSSKNLNYNKTNLIKEMNKGNSKNKELNDSKSKIMRKTHLSIDCRNNNLKSIESSTCTNLTSRREKRKLKQIITESNKVLSIKGNELKQNSNDILINIRTNNNKCLINKSLNKIKLERFIDNRINFESGKENIINEFIRNYKLKAYKHW